MNLTAMKFKSICAAKEILIVHIGWDGTVIGSKRIMLLQHCHLASVPSGSSAILGESRIESNFTTCRSSMPCVFVQ